MMKKCAPRELLGKVTSLSKREWLYIAQGICLILIVAILFYNSVFAAILMLPYLHFYLKEKRAEFARREKSRVTMQFKDGMLAISSALGAGYSFENAVKSASVELAGLYGADAVLVREFEEITYQVSMNNNVEDAINVMANRLDLEDAIYFAEVFKYAKRRGGNLVEIIGKTAKNIGDKIKVSEEIDVMISGKKMEVKVMNLMPFGIVAYLRVASYEFIAPMYGNLVGIIVMSICLAAYLGARKLSDYIVDISI